MFTHRASSISALKIFCSLSYTTRKLKFQFCYCSFIYNSLQTDKTLLGLPQAIVFAILGAGTLFVVMCQCTIRSPNAKAIETPMT